MNYVGLQTYFQTSWFYGRYKRKKSINNMKFYFSFIKIIF